MSLLLPVAKAHRTRLQIDITWAVFRIQLIVDDNVESKVSGNLVKGGELRLETNQIYVGGIPDSVHVKDMAGSRASLQGCVRELVTNG